MITGMESGCLFLAVSEAKMVDADWLSEKEEMKACCCCSLFFFVLFFSENLFIEFFLYYFYSAILSRM